MKKSYLIYLLLTTLFLASCDKEEEILQEFSLENPDQFSNEDYKVYSAALSNYNTSELIVKQQTSNLTISAETYQFVFQTENSDSLDMNLYQNFVKANSGKSLLDQQIVVSDKIVKLISNNEYGFYFESHDTHTAWNLFTEDYPNTTGYYLEVNKTAYNDDKTKALVGHQDYWFTESYGENETHKIGWITYLQKIEGQWRIIRSGTYNFL